MTEIELQYKRETGYCSYHIGIESELMTPELDTLFFQDMTKAEILDCIANDKMFWSVKMDDIPAKYKGGEDLHFPNPEYIEWLENKVKELQSI